MTMPVAHCAPVTQLNWPRIGALSGSLSMHLYVLALLLAPPIAMELLARAPSQRFVARFIAEPVPIPAKAEPILPLPARRETHHAVATMPVTERVTKASDSALVTAMADNAALPGPSVPQTSPDLAPTALAYGARTPVPYPRDALRRREHGTVVLRVLVGADGIPQTVEIESSSGSPRLDSAAREAVMHWKFQPGTRNGATCSAWARVPIAFDLSNL